MSSDSSDSVTANGSDVVPQSRSFHTELPTTDLKNIDNRRQTFINWPLDFISPIQLAEAGFYYLGIEDLVKCFSCQGVIGQWEVGDVPVEEHKKFFPGCRIVQQELQEEIGIQYVKMPKSPEYNTLEARKKTFAAWKNSTIQDPSNLSQAGFYFLGSGDEVRCFHCDGGLRNWLQNDDPWFEHARWFPKCQFVILVKGLNYIKSALENGNNQSTSQSVAANPTITIDDAMGTQPALDALAMGLNAGRCRAVMQRKLNLTGTPFESSEELVSAVLDGQIEDEGFESTEHDRRLESQVTQLLLSAVSSVGFSSDEEATSSASASASTFIPKANMNNSQLPTDERRMKNVECKICMVEEVGVVFLPCGHLLCCGLCAVALTQCPLCRGQILGRVRTFLS